MFVDIHKDLTHAHRAALLRLKEYLTPADGDLPSKVRDLVVQPGWHHRKEADDSYTDVSRELVFEPRHFFAEDVHAAIENGGDGIIDLAPVHGFFYN